MVTKVGQLSAIHSEIYTCTLCGLHAGRTRTVPGAGNPDADIMFIGEGPGYYEDQQGLPFVGKSGQYLNELLQGINLLREDIFITNVVKCRPPDNRNPTNDEIDSCNPYLRRQIEIVDPLIIVTLGGFSTNIFFPNSSITAIRGQPKYGASRAYFPVLHPAAVLRNDDMRPIMEADFARLLDVIEEVKRRRAAGDDEQDIPEEEIVNPENDPNSPKQMGLFD